MTLTENGYKYLLLPELKGNWGLYMIDCVVASSFHSHKVNLNVFKVTTEFKKNLFLFLCKINLSNGCYHGCFSKSRTLFGTHSACP